MLREGRTLRQIWLLIKSDRFRIGGGSFVYNIILGRNPSQQFLFWFRMCESKLVLLRFLGLLQRGRLSRRYGVQIPAHTHIGAGLKLPHCLSIVVHPKAVIGMNCTIHQFVTIGGDINGVAPKIGDNCYIGSGAVLLGDIKIGNNVTIGANAVVVKDVPENATVVGVPARVIHYNTPSKYIFPSPV